MATYDRYEKCVRDIVSSQNLSTFKSNPTYNAVLEHVDEKGGAEYYNLLVNRSMYTREDIRTFCTMNDRLGSPLRYAYGDGLVCSPTSLRYLWHAHLILSWFKSFDKFSYDIVEIGGGYGGLCAAICLFAKKYNIAVPSYTIIDLPHVGDLQNIYLSDVQKKDSLFNNTQLSFVDAYTYGAGIQKDNLYLISNYCFSEIPLQYQQLYRNILFPKVKHGFMAWNMIPVYHFGFAMREEEETPNTGNVNSVNKFVYF